MQYLHTMQKLHIICKISFFKISNNMYVFHILIILCMFAINYILYVPILWYARILSSIRKKKNQPN